MQYKPSTKAIFTVMPRTEISKNEPYFELFSSSRLIIVVLTNNYQTEVPQAFSPGYRRL